MSNGREEEKMAPLGNVAGLIYRRRTELKLSQTRLASQAGISRQRIIAAEADESIPTMEVCLKLVSHLGIDRVEMVRALMKDLVQGAEPDAVAEIEAELSGKGLWSSVAEHHGLIVEHAEASAVVNESGDTTIRRHYSGCRATRPRKSIVFWHRVVGEEPPNYAVKGSPKGLGYSVHLEMAGALAYHRVEFVRPWTADDRAFDFEVEMTLQHGLVLDLDDYNRRRVAEGLPTQNESDWRGDFRCTIEHPCESFDLSVSFPRDYEPHWHDPTATWGNIPISFSDYTKLDERTCRDSKLHTQKSEAGLSLVRPCPGYTFGLRWQPVARKASSES